ncbi:hypothetical protein CKA32_001964 [Geitlerinema sp. FC II]|nr:hypothetical protein CKA32_001964 [Geitlerinema sp. FC II]
MTFICSAGLPAERAKFLDNGQLVELLEFRSILFDSIDPINFRCFSERAN